MRIKLFDKRDNYVGSIEVDGRTKSSGSGGSPLGCLGLCIGVMIFFAVLGGLGELVCPNYRFEYTASNEDGGLSYLYIDNRCPFQSNDSITGYLSDSTSMYAAKLGQIEEIEGVWGSGRLAFSSLSGQFDFDGKSVSRGGEDAYESVSGKYGGKKNMSLPYGLGSLLVVIVFFARQKITSGRFFA